MNQHQEKQISKLSDFAKQHYLEDTNRIIDHDIQLSTKLAAILGMLECYYDAYVLNQKDLLVFANKVAKEHKNHEPKALKLIAKTSKNKINKIKNQQARFDKFNKEFSVEFTKHIGVANKKIAEPLIDAFDVFWQTIVTIDGKNLKIKKHD